jgi:ABC-type uncharacterized transport system involved in gliding motility auxiliary subunit
MTHRLVNRLNEQLTPLLLVAVAILLGWLSLRFPGQWDLTRNGGNSLSETSIRVLQRTEGPLEVTAYAPELPNLRDKIRRFIALYQYQKPDLTLRFVDPFEHPDEARRQGISLNGELLLRYRDREERLQALDEPHLTGAIQRLQQTDTRWVAGLRGHGERSLLGQANHDLGTFGEVLAGQGYQVVELDLATTPVPPDNTALLVIASPLKALLEAELNRVGDYLQSGKNLLLLIDPAQQAIQQPLLDLIGILQLPGTVVDANVRDLGIDNPAVALVAKYPEHPAIRGFNLISLYPQAAALQLAPVADADWQIAPLLQTLTHSWNETGPLTGEIQRDPADNEQPGPLSIGYVLSRQQGEREQRVMVIGDGDFLSNSYLDNAGNQDLGLSLLRWLVADDRMLGIPPREILDRELRLSPLAQGIIGLSTLILLPLLFLSIGGILAWRRNRA